MPRKAQTESVSDLNAAPGGAAAVDRALSLLSSFQPGDDALTLAQFAERTQLYKSTVLRLLASLEHARLILKQDDGRYALGMEIARLHSLYGASLSLDRIVPPV
ncbi:MAG: helix-turn-helix domain-containing protein, partial [Variovorax sp.]